MDEPANRMRLVVGLGNPGRSYEKTRHNLGFRVVDAYLAGRGLQAGRHKFHASMEQTVRGGLTVVFLKPQTFMNASGQSVREAVDFYGIAPADCLVICDCMHLPLGRIRVRRGGSDAGHKGLRSVAEHLGTQEFPRLRIGIGEPTIEAVEYVLSAFEADERPVIEEAVARACQGVDIWLEQGIEACMNAMNG